MSESCYMKILWNQLQARSQDFTHGGGGGTEGARVHFFLKKVTTFSSS